MKKTVATILEEDGQLSVTAQEEPQLIKELIAVFKAKESYGALVIESKHLDSVIDICRDYCFKVFYSGEYRKTYEGRFV